MRRQWGLLFFAMAANLILLRDVRFLLLFSLLIILRSVFFRSKLKARMYGDVLMVFLCILAVWAGITLYVPLKNPGLYPEPRVVLDLLIADFPRFLWNFAVSMRIYLMGLGIAIAVGMSIGLVIGLSERTRDAFSPYIKVIGAISPIAYIPYIIGIMPTFWAASVFVVFFGTVWSVMKWTIYGIASMDQYIYTCAKLLNVSRWSFFSGVLLPGIAPCVLEGVTQAVTMGFSVLIAAEMIGSRDGLGFYIKYYADFLNYPKVITGIIYLGGSICLMTWLQDQCKKKLLKWQNESKGIIVR